MNSSKITSDLAGDKGLRAVIRERRSIFPPAFTDQNVSDDLIDEILTNANFAPTHKLTQPWRFKVVRGKGLERLSRFMEQYYLDHTPDEMISEKKQEKTRMNPLRSSAVILICMQRDPMARIPEWEEVASVACAVQNLWLSATSLGVGGYWSTPATISEMDRFVPLNEGETCLGLFYLGYHEQPHTEAVRSDWAEKVEWIEE